MREYPYNEVNLQTAILWIADRAQRLKSQGKCKTCEGSIEDVLKISSRPDAIRQCVKCGQIYRYTQLYEYLAGGSEESEEMKKISPDEIANEFQTILKSYAPAKKIIFTGSGWEVDF